MHAHTCKKNAHTRALPAELNTSETCKPFRWYGKPRNRAARLCLFRSQMNILRRAFSENTGLEETISRVFCDREAKHRILVLSLFCTIGRVFVTQRKSKAGHISIRLVNLQRKGSTDNFCSQARAWNSKFPVLVLSFLFLPARFSFVFQRFVGGVLQTFFLATGTPSVDTDHPNPHALMLEHQQVSACGACADTIVRGSRGSTLVMAMHRGEDARIRKEDNVRGG